MEGERASMPSRGQVFVILRSITSERVISETLRVVSARGLLPCLCGGGGLSSNTAHCGGFTIQRRTLSEPSPGMAACSSRKGSAGPAGEE